MPSSTMQILRASHLGMCFGVRDAIELAVERAGTAPLTVLGDLVHNDAVLARLRFPEADVRFSDTVCRPTKQRQAAAIDLARRADVVIVVGGASSNNTRQLVETCSRYCARVHHVETDADLCADWFREAATVGL